MEISFCCIKIVSSLMICISPLLNKQIPRYKLLFNFYFIASCNYAVEARDIKPNFPVDLQLTISMSKLRDKGYLISSARRLIYN